MIALVIAAAMMVQVGSADRTAYRTCLSDAVTSAKGANVAVDGFKDYARKTRAAVEDGFKSKLVSFNVKNGMSKKTAAEDAEVQLDDYLYTAEEKYRYSFDQPN